MVKFPEPKEGSVFYENERVYAYLAFHPIVEGHSIVVWKEDVEDLNQLRPEDYQYFMGVVYRVRKVLLAVYETDKVYLAYLDEARHVHVHLLPRKKGTQEGFTLMTQPHDELTDLSKISSLRSLMTKRCDRK